MPQSFSSKIRLSIKSTFYVYIGTVKFSSLFKESPCSPGVTFPSSGSEGHGVQPLRGTPFFFFFYIFMFSFKYVFLFIFCLRSFKLCHVNVKKKLKKDIKPT